jgi:hypothetical protein
MPEEFCNPIASAVLDELVERGLTTLVIKRTQKNRGTDADQRGMFTGIGIMLA